MFYHQSILQRRGQFGIIWLAATKIDQLKRREMTAVNLHKTCQDIINFILVRMQPRYPGGNRPRFSLYLSSQLMYGVIKIYKKQSEYLLDEVSTFFTRIRMNTANLEEIDLKGIFRSEFVTNPDLLMISSQTQQGYDPLFGLLSMDEQVPQQLSLPEMELWRIESTDDERKSAYGSPVPRMLDETKVSDRRSRQGSPHTVSSRDDITIKEVESTSVTDSRIMPQDDLPTFDGKQMEMILEEPQDVRLNMAEYLSPIRPVLDNTIPEKTDVSRGILSPKEKTPMTRTEDPIQVPETRVQVLSPGVTPAPLVDSRPHRKAKATLNLELSPVIMASPARRRRRRDRLIIDQEMQISKAQLKDNLNTGSDLCEAFVLPDVHRSNVPDLFRRPAQGCLHNKPLIDLWLRNAKYGILETESDIETPYHVVTDPTVLDDERPPKKPRTSRKPLEPSPEKAREEEISIRFDEQPSVELARDGSLSMEQSRIADLTPVSLRQSILSDHDKSKESVKEDTVKKSAGKRRKSRGTSSEEEQDLIPPTHLDLDTTSLLQDLNLSVVHEEQESQLMISPTKKIRTEDSSASHNRLIRKINSMTGRQKYVTFSDVFPPYSTNRIVASKMFAVLLDLSAAKKLNVEQDVPYQDIFISRGEEW